MDRLSGTRSISNSATVFSRRSFFLIVLLFMIIYVLPLGFRPVFTPDEARYGAIAREMISSGNWTVPTLDGFRYFEKPAMGYWMIAISMKIFGENAFAIRLPSALAAGLSGLMVYALARRFAGGYIPAFFSLSIFLLSVEVFLLGQVAILDSMLSFCLVAVMSSFFFALNEERLKYKVLYLAIAGIACGAAFSTKGFLAFAVPAVAILPYMIWEKRWKEILVLPWIPALFAVLFCLPWALQIHKAEPGFWHYFFFIEHLQRFLDKDSYQHTEPFWFFIPVLVAGALPWTLLIFSIIFGTTLTKFKSPFLKYCLCWLVMPFIFFSISRGKLPTYILPCFAPLSILIASGLLRAGMEKENRIPFYFSFIIPAYIFGLAGLLLAVNAITGFPQRLYFPEETFKAILASASLLIWSLLLFKAIRVEDFKHKMMLFCLAPLAFMMSFSFIIPDRVAIRKAPEKFIASMAGEVDKSTVLVSYKDPLHLVCWTLKRSDVWVFFKAGELDEGVKFEDSKHRYLKDFSQFNKFVVAQNADSKKVLLFIPGRIYKEYSDRIIKPDAVFANGYFAMLKYDLRKGQLSEAAEAK